ncbi:MAG: aminoacyl--tRNA ligase-related protein, partial [Nanoarchaeota archaeon]
MAKENNQKDNQKNNQKNEMSLGITVKKEDDINEWYSQVMLKSGFADYAPVKGCMIIRPLAYSCWEMLMDYFNKEIRKKNVQNAYFPMFIPQSFFLKEAKHAEGFKPEVAWIQNKDDKQERLAIRPTSETIIYDSYSKWIRSHRDLPLKINQWCNICRWEVQDVKLFMRSREFLWQEGHCVYSNEEECENEALDYLELYRKV